MQKPPRNLEYEKAMENQVAAMMKIEKEDPFRKVVALFVFGYYAFFVCDFFSGMSSISSLNIAY